MRRWYSSAFLYFSQPCTYKGDCILPAVHAFDYTPTQSTEMGSACSCDLTACVAIRDTVRARVQGKSERIDGLFLKLKEDLHEGVLADPCFSGICGNDDCAALLSGEELKRAVLRDLLHLLRSLEDGVDSIQIAREYGAI